MSVREAVAALVADLANASDYSLAEWFELTTILSQEKANGTYDYSVDINVLFGKIQKLLVDYGLVTEPDFQAHLADLD